MSRRSGGSEFQSWRAKWLEALLPTAVRRNCEVKREASHGTGESGSVDQAVKLFQVLFIFSTNRQKILLCSFSLLFSAFLCLSSNLTHTKKNNVSKTNGKIELKVEPLLCNHLNKYQNSQINFNCMCYFIPFMYNLTTAHAMTTITCFLNGSD